MPALTSPLKTHLFKTALNLWYFVILWAAESSFIAYVCFYCYTPVKRLFENHLNQTKSACLKIQNQLQCLPSLGLLDDTFCFLNSHKCSVTYYKHSSPKCPICPCVQVLCPALVDTVHTDMRLFRGREVGTTGQDRGSGFYLRLTEMITSWPPSASSFPPFKNTQYT